VSTTTSVSVSSVSTTGGAQSWFAVPGVPRSVAAAFTSGLEKHQLARLSFSVALMCAISSWKDRPARTAAGP
jgi:hypothetical protein